MYNLYPSVPQYPKFRNPGALGPPGPQNRPPGPKISFFCKKTNKIQKKTQKIPKKHKKSQKKTKKSQNKSPPIFNRKMPLGGDFYSLGKAEGTARIVFFLRWSQGPNRRGHCHCQSWRRRTKRSWQRCICEWMPQSVIWQGRRSQNCCG